MEKIKFAVVGYGHIGKRHADMINLNIDAELLAVCDVLTNPNINKEYVNIPYFTSIDQMLTSIPEIEVVNICTPNGLHAEHSLISLHHKKHIVCEKPMCLKKLDCDKIILKSIQVSRNVFCVMQNRYSPPAQWLKKVIDQKLLGEIFYVQINCFWNRDDKYYKQGGWKGKNDLDGGTLFTQFSHFIDIMYWLFGDIEDVNGVFKDFNHNDLTDFEDSGFINFKFIKEGIGSFNYSTSVWQKNLESSITIIGAKGSVKIGGQYMNEVQLCEIENYQMPILSKSNPANNYGDYIGSAANHHLVIENVISTLRNQSSATTNVSDGMKVVEIIERIYRLKNKNFKKNVSKTYQ
jgi:UDP-N-acetyl-2-amino-2-deoxyglucuronate dehydrogenase